MVAVSGTRRAIDQAGVADEYAYQLKKRGTELRRDIEHNLIHTYQVAGVSGAIGDSNSQTTTGYSARTFGGYRSWINTPSRVEHDGFEQSGGNVIYKDNWAAPLFDANSGTDNQARGTHIPRADFAGAASAAPRSPLALSDIDLAMQRIYENGGKANKLMLSPKLRRDFSDLMVTDSGVRRNIDMDGKLRQSVDVYMSDFGDVMVVPNYIMGLSHSVNFGNANGSGTAGGVNVANFAALLYDPMWFAIATLRPLQEVDVGQRGDSTIGMMIEEMTLEVKNPQGCSAIYGLM